jgi:hypothetical protein
LLLVLEAGEEEMRQRMTRCSGATAPRRPGELREIRIGAFAPWLPSFEGPPVVHVEGPHLLELVVGDEAVAHPTGDGLAMRG